MNKDDYNEDPVYYCSHCLSLKIRYVSKLDNSEYCDECGSTNIEQCSIEEWEKKYKDKYGFKFIEK